MTPPYFMRIYVYFLRSVELELPPHTVANASNDKCVVSSSMIVGLHIGKIMYEH